jgi:hypothetical protein
MGIGASILMAAVGAVLTFATYIDTSGLGFQAGGVSLAGVDMDAVGIILMIVGGLGLVAATVSARGRSSR